MRRLVWDMHALICEQTARRLHGRFEIPDRMSRFELRLLEAWATGRMSRSSPSTSSSIDEDQAPTCTPGLSRDVAPRRSQRVISTAPLPSPVFDDGDWGRTPARNPVSFSAHLPSADGFCTKARGRLPEPSTLSVVAGKFER